MFHEPSRQPPLQHLPSRPEESFLTIEFKGNATGCSWHFHPEYQLSVVVNGKGQRIVGDAVCTISCGEVVLLGSNLPHVWRYEATQSDVQAVVVHFGEDFAGAGFLNRPEMRSIRLLLARASQGLQVHGADRDLAASILSNLPRKSGFERVLDLMRVLHTLASSKNLVAISSFDFGGGNGVDLERLRCVFAYLNEHLHLPVSREDVATVAHLNPNAFSRFFRQHTGLTFQEYLTERRIGRACELLMDISQSITDVAFDCGFSNSTSFTRAFRRVKEMTPSDYRARVTDILSQGH